MFSKLFLSLSKKFMKSPRKIEQPPYVNCSVTPARLGYILIDRPRPSNLKREPVSSLLWKNFYHDFFLILSALIIKICVHLRLFIYFHINPHDPQVTNTEENRCVYYCTNLLGYGAGLYLRTFAAGLRLVVFPRLIPQG